MIVSGKIIRRESGADNHHRLGEELAHPNNHGLKDDAVPEQESARMVEAWVYAYGEAGLFAWFAQQRRP
ncbi:hypothetical protein MasN3_38110 [Massilia varians]|uniref:Uncharacterized protein n=1 Tax=Massilia varians TaxID=457921 RepID=A0ABM8CAL2_9BURK|nr:hypothetical protein [Massilia varians]BDT60317.1 hypothetical protein MasN3_38110 [Massilia varians]